MRINFWKNTCVAQAGGKLGGLVRVALALMLAVVTCVPARAFAVAERPGFAAFSLVAPLALQAEGTDLNGAWRAQDGGLSATFTIGDGGTYYLSADLEAESNLVVNAPGQDVVIRFGGHALTLDGSGPSARKTMLSIEAARSVTLDGSADEAGAATDATPEARSGETPVSTIQSAGENDVWGIASSAAGCTVTARDLTVTLASKEPSQRYLSTHAIRMDGGTLSLTRCTVNMLMGNQTLSSESLAYDTGEPPSAVYATAATAAVTLDGCTVRGEGTQGFGCALASTDTLGNAYALYSLAGATTVRGGTYLASSPLGNATCLYASALDVAPGAAEGTAEGSAADSAPLSLEADAGQLATGILSAEVASVTLNAPFTFASGSLYAGYAQAEAALRSQVAGGFVFGDCAPAAGSFEGSATAAAYPVLVMTPSDDLDSANAPGVVIGSFASSLDASQRAAVLASLGNALGIGCSVVADALGQACFAFDSSNSADAVAQVDGACYPTLASALKALSDGGTLTLLADVGALTIADVSDARIDLNGHTISSLEYAAPSTGDGLNVRNGTVNGTRAVDGSRVAVYQNALAPLTLSGVTVKASGSDANVYGVYAAASKGPLTLDEDTRVVVTAGRTSSSAAAYGVGMPASGTGSALVIDNADISVSTGSAGVPVYGVSCTNGATVSGCGIRVTGADATTGAIYALGPLAVSGARIDVYTTGASGSSSGFGIGARSSTNTRTAIESSTVRLHSAADVSALPYACLLASTSEANVSSASWSLSGSCSFESDSGMHVGLNAGEITLGSDFSLADGSDAPLVISQAKQADDRGFTVAGDVDEAQLDALTRLFEAGSGSYYDGWSLEAERAAATSSADDAASCAHLAWRQGTASTAPYSLVRAGSVQATHATLGSALAAAQSGDTVRLERDAKETGTQAIAQDDLTIDLNGHALVLQAGGMTAAASDAFDAVRYTGAGSLTLRGGTVDVRLGAAREVARASSVPYEGIGVAGDGTLRIAPDATVSVSYVGSTGASALDRSVRLRGISLSGGRLALEGTLNVSGAPAPGSIGSMLTQGVFSQSGAPDAVDIARTAQVNVVADAGANVIGNAYHAETTYLATTNDGPKGLREIAVDPVTDSVFYQDIVKRFREVATYDDPDDTTQRNTFNAGVYYANNMVVAREGAWYDGLRIWAYSDEVARADVGTLATIVPAHVFVSSQCETLPEARGVETGPQTSAGATAAVRGAVNVSCPHGNACALRADGAAAWTCAGATLCATGDDGVHAIAQRPFDLRDYVSFSSKQDKAVVYPGTAAAQVVKFEPASARDVVVGEQASFSLAGATALSAAALDAAQVEAASFAVDPTFSLSTHATAPVAAAGAATAPFCSTCAVAHPSGAHALGATFAKGATAAQAALFEDAHRSLLPGAAADGVAWTQAVAVTVAFQVGDAVVARYADPGSIDLSEPTALARRAGDQRQEYRVVGWSRGADENATEGYLEADGTVSPAESSVYRAVFETSLATVPVTFENAFDADGVLQPPVTLSAVYGQSVAEALDAAHVAVPQPADYVRDGVAYRFAGWYPYSAADTSGALLYDAAKLADLDVTLAVNGVSASGLVLRAVYVAALPGQHVIAFKVDGFTSVCVVDDGARPVFKQANATNTNSVSPAKQVVETGRKHTFAHWFVDADGDGKRSEAEPAYPSVLPPACEDAVYRADWTSEWADVTLTFFVKLYDETSGTLNESATRVVETTYDKSVQDVADGIAKIGSSFNVGGKTYVLQGWAPRKTDVEALYDAANPLPSAGDGDRALSSSYSKTFYAVYKTSDHVVDVTFYDSDGTRTLGVAQGVLAVSTSVDAAFAATGAKRPADTSANGSFIGWAASPRATEALDGASTMVESLTGREGTALSLYAVYGAVPAYTVRLRSEDGATVMYRVSVKRGATIAEVLAAAETPVRMSPQAGRYFAGWYTAAGKFFSLNEPVTGSMNLYARFGDIAVDTGGAKGVSASVTLDTERFSQLGLVRELAGVSFSIAPKDAADSPLRTETAKHGYTVLKSYTLKLAANYATGESELQQGAFGAAAVKVKVGARHRNARMRVFWLGLKDGEEAVLISAEKKVDAEGFITVSIGNTEVGDEDEGGNFCVASIEGGTGEGALKPGATTDGGAGSGDAAGVSRGLGASGLGSRGLPGAGALALQNSGGGAPGVAAEPSADGAAGGERAQGAADEAETTGADDGDEPFFASWESDAVVLAVLAAIAVGAMLSGLWRLVVVRQRRAEAEAEMPALAETYANGITF